jgi:hypothetical protein
LLGLKLYGKQAIQSYLYQKRKTFHLAPTKETLLLELWKWANQMFELPPEQCKSATLTVKACGSVERGKFD